MKLDTPFFYFDTILNIPNHSSWSRHFFFDFLLFLGNHDSEDDMKDNRGQELKKLFIKFRKSFAIMGDRNEEMNEFAKLLDINS